MPNADLFVGFAGSASSVESQLERAVTLLAQSGHAAGVSVCEDDPLRWEEESATSVEEWLLLRVGALPSRLPEVARRLDRLAGACETVRWRAHADAGRLRVSIKPRRDYAACAEAVARLRGEVQTLGASLVVEVACGEARRALEAIKFDPWGVGESSLRLMRRVKERLDPRGLFSPGLFFA
ncbi:MAG: hypothetical protein LC746_07640 [Acidobacteria bacterium]|nr:hypothetical protein [Acidobacteriota bacterium]